MVGREVEQAEVVLVKLNLAAFPGDKPIWPKIRSIWRIVWVTGCSRPAAIGRPGNVTSTRSFSLLRLARRCRQACFKLVVGRLQRLLDLVDPLADARTLLGAQAPHSTADLGQRPAAGQVLAAPCSQPVKAVDSRKLVQHVVRRCRAARSCIPETQNRTLVRDEVRPVVPPDSACARRKLSQPG